MTSCAESVRRLCRIIIGLKCVLCAAITRLAFTGHCLLAVGRIAFPPTEWNQRWLDVYWLLLSGLAGLLVEAVVTICVRKGAEYKWFCPSVFFYLLTLIPCVWVLELSMLEYRLNSETCSSATTINADSMQNLTLFSGVALHFEPSQSVVLIEQLLLFVLIMGRWLLPKGDISRDELSQLLLVYIGMAADIIEFFEAFKEEKVKCNLQLIVTILTIWSASLLQFTLVLTASKAKKIRAGYAGKPGRTMCRCDCCSDACSCCGTEVFGILTTMLLQDGPFLSLRVLLLVRYEVKSYMHIFFTVKNSLVILLMVYRLIVLWAATEKAATHDEEAEDCKMTSRIEIKDDSKNAGTSVIYSAIEDSSLVSYGPSSLFDKEAAYSIEPVEIKFQIGDNVSQDSSQELTLFDFYLDYKHYSSHKMQNDNM